MGAGHAHDLYLPRRSPLHRLRPECKVAATVLFVLAVVAAPREALWAYGAFAAMVAAAAAIGRVPLGHVARRLVIETPFVAFALFLPFVAQGERIEVLGLQLSRGGLWAMWNVLAKATLGVAATVVLASTTEVPALLRGLERLRVPPAFTSVAAFMVRYLDVVAGELRRMSVARQSRAADPRLLWQAKAVAGSVGSLFVRSYERGERVYMAMVARGFTGTMPVLHDEGRAPPGQWAAALAAPALAAVVASTAWAIR